MFEQFEALLGPYGEYLKPLKGLFGKFIPKAPDANATFEDLQQNPKNLIFASIMRLFETTTAQDPKQALANMLPKAMVGILAGVAGWILPSKSKAFKGVMSLANRFAGDFFGAKPQEDRADADLQGSAAEAALDARRSRDQRAGAAVGRAIAPGFAARREAAREARQAQQAQTGSTLANKIRAEALAKVAARRPH